MNRNMDENRRNAGRADSFTLTEMLTVVAIIVILAMIMFKIGVYLFQKSGRARATYTLQQVKNFLEEYHSVYGSYPNCGGFTWENTREGPKPPNWGEIVDLAPQFTNTDRGLAYYMWSDEIPGNYRNRWREFVGDPDSTPLDHLWRYMQKHAPNMGEKGLEGGAFVYSNRMYKLLDPWDRDYGYSAGTENPPQSYRVYSKGPDGKANTADDIGYGRWTE